MKDPLQTAAHSRHATRLGAIVLSFVLLGCESAPAADPAASAPEVNYEGLEIVAGKRLDVAQVRPGVDFAAYSAVRFVEPELAFQTPDRSQRQFPLNEAQKQRFRDMLAAEFEKELSRLESLELATEPGPDVLTLSVRVQDIAVAVSDESLSRASRGAAFLEASGDATVVLELKDSQSNQILARGVDTRSVEGVAVRQRGDTMVTRFESADKVVSKWAATARTAIDALTSER